MDWATKLKAGAARMRERCILAALANTPASVKVIRVRQGLGPGVSHATWRSTRPSAGLSTVCGRRG